MTNKQKTTLSVLAVIISAALVVFSVNSVSAIGFVKPAEFVHQATQVRQEMKGVRQEAVQQHQVGKRKVIGVKNAQQPQEACERAKSRYQERLNSYPELESRYRARYQTAVSRITAALDKLESLGLDVSEARSKLSTWKTKVDAASASLHDSIGSLQSLAEIDCNNLADARTQVKAVQAELKQTRDLVKEARTYYWQEVRPALLALRQQAQSLR